MIVKAVIKKNKHTCMNVIEGVISEFRLHRRSHAGESIVMKLLVRNMFIRLKYIFTFIFNTHFQFVEL